MIISPLSLLLLLPSLSAGSPSADHHHPRRPPRGHRRAAPRGDAADADRRRSARYDVGADAVVTLQTQTTDAVLDMM